MTATETGPASTWPRSPPRSGPPWMRLGPLARVDVVDPPGAARRPGVLPGRRLSTVRRGSPPRSCWTYWRACDRPARLLPRWASRQCATMRSKRRPLAGSSPPVPLPTGPEGSGSDPKELARLTADRTRLEQETARLRAVLRSTQRHLGVKEPPVPEKPAAPGKKPRKGRRPTVRALTVVRQLLRCRCSLDNPVSG